MNSFFEIVIAIALIGSIQSINIDLMERYKNVCKLENGFDRDLKHILEREEPYKSCDHSVGFHLTKDICQEITNNSSNIKKSLTAYLSEEFIVLFVVIPPETEGNRSILDLTFVKSLKWEQSFTVVWIKIKAIEMTAKKIYAVSYTTKSNRTQTVHTKDLSLTLRNEDQIILKNIKTYKLNQHGHKQEYTIQGNDTSFSVEDSYLIFCLESDKKKSNCRPIQVNGYGISCECDTKNKLTTFFILIVFWGLTVAFTVKPLIALILDKGDKDKTDFPMVISCNQKTSKFEYIIGLRMAKTSSNFDLTDVNIDIEFLTATNENVAPVFRFKANVLEKQLLTTIRIFMWRLTKLPELKKVQCSHSGISDGRITLFGVFVFCRKGTDDFKIYNINKNITRDNRILLMIKEDEKNEKPIEENHIKTLSNFEFSYTFLELIWILFVNISLIAFIAAFIPIRLVSVLLEMLIIILISSSVVILFNIGFLKLYKYMLLQELRQQAKMDSKYEKILFFAVRVYYVISILISVMFGLIIGYTKISQKNVKTYQWFCITFCATALFVIVSIIISRINLTRRKEVSEASVEDTVSSIGSQENSQLM